MIDIINWAKEDLALGNIGVSLVLLTIGAVLLFVRPRWGRGWIVAVLLGYWIASSPFGSTLFITPLVRPFHSIEDPREAASAGAVVVLGGGITAVKARSGAIFYPFETTSLRLVEAARVFRLLNGRPLVVASGGRTNAVSMMSEGVVMADALTRLNVPRDRIVIEEASLTTHEQAIIVTELLRSRGISRFVLVTSPTHMLRADAVFRAQGADVIPSIAAQFPERPRTPLFLLPNEDSLHVFDNALYDYAGLVYYWSKGWLRQPPARAGP